MRQTPKEVTVTDIFHEVEEDVRKERYEALWKKYGVYMIAAAILLVAGLAGYQQWQRYDLRQRQQASARFTAAEQLAATGNPKSEQEFAALAKDAPAGYAKLAKFQQAKVMIAQGKSDQAVVLLRELANDSDPLLGSAAKLRLAWTLADTAPRNEIDALIAPLSATDSPWRYAADELRAYLALQSGKRAEAQAGYEKLAAETGAADNMRQRASAIAQYLKANPTAAAGNAAAVPPAPASEKQP